MTLGYKKGFFVVVFSKPHAKKIYRMLFSISLFLNIIVCLLSILNYMKLLKYL